MEGAFLEFLRELSEGHCTADAWQQFAVAHYANPVIEESRRELVRVSIALGGSCGTPVPDALRMVATELRARIVANMAK